MIIVIGEILIDIFKDTRQIGGAPFNFAFHLKKMGLPVRFISRVGQDESGREILEWVGRHGFSIADIQIDADHPTGTVLVDLDDDGVPRFDIRADAAYDYLDLDSLQNADGDALRMIYYGTLVQRTDHGFGQVRRFITRKASQATCFCDINMRPPHVNFQAVDNCLAHSDILKLNDGELETLQAHIHGPDQRDDFVGWLMGRFGIETVALTLGGRGSVLYRHGEIIHSGPSASALNSNTVVADTVGAGDGYAAVLALGCLNGLAPQRSIELAADFAARICSIRGAVPDEDEIYSDLLNQLKGDLHGR